ncbi:MAG: prepilin-type N-terminal cleavage/methylation domain-containing protein, partial [Chloroflexi bacterium]|nr:prepilin-type N-terminal cleavage/methylation domain-containing protein [Chloroflexota bacterium]MCI0901815.1 prepilin-type N-terminal cleavage/methylation domain-containing protein [Chloroflexota bacterium]
MRNILKRTLGSRSEDQKGFTLIELLVVVGIIVALAAVIVPLVIQ